jgi:hypothetical protein
MASRWRAALDLPELHVAIFAFLLSFAWEILQSGFFRGMLEARHGDAVRLCMIARAGDVGIMLASFWGVAGLGGGRQWARHPTPAQIAGFTAFGLAISIIVERLAMQEWGLWCYSDAMPVIPILEVGLIPLLMWSVLPPLVIWFVHRQLGE